MESASTYTAKVPVDAAQLWSVVTDWSRHEQFVPATRITVTGPPGDGQRLDAFTGIGPVGFHDLMVVSEYRAPGGDEPAFLRLDKYGPVLAGWATIEVRPQGSSSSVLTWVERVRPAGPAWLVRLSDRPGELFTRAFLARLAGGLVDQARSA
ncbi:hypothetical protein ACMYYO_04155 [Dermacoccaceae bacterium W4C1]